MPILVNTERSTRALVLGALLAFAVVSVITVTHPPDVMWDKANGHRTMMGRSGNTTLLQLLLKIGAEAAKVLFLPVVGYVCAALASHVSKGPLRVAGLLWALWVASILGWVVFGDWSAMGD
ncbi:hypothetical protein SAMN04515668_4770 [Hymenobacter arizonensis]|uniref:Uncharacterized protein n=2 Tax=Hymenobacter arizonensis TaxID=1227077 RepID=A0A1I6BMY6_HYMAR|nr:hypothetical protein SAMN04515668_4770 [Hymenobacter arizonensis]